jgi:hypothetical protein
MLLLFLIFTLVASISATLIQGRDDLEPINTLIPATSALPLSSFPTDLFPLPFTDDEEHIEGTSFFSINPGCKQDARDIGNSGFPNRHAFYTQAYKDAVLIASSTSDWPMRNTLASNTYSGKNKEDAKHSDDIAGIYQKQPTPLKVTY